MNRVHTEQGSFILSLLISTTAGVLFVFLYFNLAEYVNASAALEHAAAKAARCVTSMDAECTSYAHSGAPTPSKISWYGFHGSGGIDLAVPMVDYNAQMYAKRFSADYSAFSSHAINKSVSWNTYRVDQYRAHIEQKAFLEAYGTLIGHTEVQFYTPIVEGFPAVEKDDSKSIEAWLAAETAAGSNQPFVEAPLENSVPLRIPENSILEVKSAWITVPELDASTQCRTSSGRECSVTAGAGGTPNSGDWQKMAFLAVKAFANAQSDSTKSSAELRWSKGEGLEGLRVFVNDSQGSRSYCLGGRVDSGVPPKPDSRWVDLYLRGPANASGGDGPNDILTLCKNEGMDHYDQMYVMRGGQFQIVGYLKSTQGIVDVTPYFYYYFDNYNLSTTSANIACNDVRYSFSRNWPMCETIAPQNCQVADPIAGQNLSPNYFQWVWLDSDCILDQSKYPNDMPAGHEVAWNGTAWNNVCSNDGNNTTIASCPNLVKNSQTVALCGSPDLLKGFAQPDAGCGVCSSGVEKVESAEVANPGSCPSLSPIAHSFNCTNDFRYRSNDGNPRDTCAGIGDQITPAETATRSFNQTERQLGLPLFGESVSLNWSAAQPQSGPEDFSWNEAGPSGQSVLYPEALTKKNYSLPNTQAIVRYRRTTSPDYTIAAADFLGAIAADPQHPQSSLGWGDYQQRVNEFVRIKGPGDESAIVLTGNPFDEAVPQMYWGQALDSGAYEFADISCHAQSSCPHPFIPYANEEAMLRAFAAHSIPEANDSQYLFTYTAQPSMHSLGRFSSTGEANSYIASLDYEQCTPYRAICHDGQVTAAEAELVVEGPIEQYSSLPASCADGTYVNCFNKIDLVDNGTVEPPISPTINYAAAKMAALHEIDRVLPQLGGRLCEGANGAECVAVDVTDSNDGGNQAAVTVSFELPISFPLSTILGRDTMHMSYTKSGVFESAIVGRDT